ncbi:O-6-methylguanine DNA methyltransferase [Papiliotrema laurentii]|jgi:AraC family transcriptional regulator of adaptative response/methylated-DNA-[protein]-cysteine methyltransferase|uniref:Methylated-DNA--protein-cysteine methyltransferase n=1 Tax=Papiliotrema laurentii TaxID=5418 RepID=A0AAD9FNY5_PAPLA|nr:O-6-methylguanine DNA methyltransferase [Papiliotrema laurentii]
MWSTLPESKRAKIPKSNGTVAPSYAIGKSALGLLAVVTTAQRVIHIGFGSTPTEIERDLSQRYPAGLTTRSNDFTNKTLRELVAYIDDPSLPIPSSLRPTQPGTEFQQRVWKAISAIPLGATASYADIAREIGSPTASRAVAQACGRNALAVVVPCHRVVGSGGSLGGYRWGVERKKMLLERELAASRQGEVEMTGVSG